MPQCQLDITASRLERVQKTGAWPKKLCLSLDSGSPPAGKGPLLHPTRGIRSDVSLWFDLPCSSSNGEMERDAEGLIRKWWES